MIGKRHAAIDWWRDMQPDPDKHRPGDRAGLARLRRCGSVVEAMQDPAAIALFHRCKASHFNDLPIIGLAASVLAQVQEDQPALKVARRIGPKSPDKPETALLKPLRFRRLLEASTGDESLLAFRRLVALARGALNIRDLSDALLDWTDERRSDERRRRWVVDYWNADSVRPAVAVTTMKDTAA